MPGVGTHTTIIQRLAKSAQGDPDVAAFLTDPDLNADWTKYSTAEALQSRYAVLGALGPDMFYAMLDYGSGIQDLEDVAMKLAGTFRCVGQLSSRLNNLIGSALNDFTDEVWGDIQTVFARVNGILTEGAIDLLIDRANLWSVLLPLRQVDDFQNNWYWADFLHYVKTGCFTQKLLDNAAALRAADPGSATGKCLSAYALGYLTHYISDTAGHGWVNRIVESPYRNMWQRHHVVESFIDAHVWASWHDKGAEAAAPADEPYLDTTLTTAGDPMRGSAARFSYARLNDLCNIGSPGIDPFIDNALDLICNQIQQGLFHIGASSVQPPQTPNDPDPIFTTWTQFICDTIRQTYPPGQMHPSRLVRYPTPDDVAGAYSAFRVLLSLATEDDVEPPSMPKDIPDPGAVLDQMWQKIKDDLAMTPPPPSPAGGGSPSLQALWDSIKAELNWLGQVADAALNALKDFFEGLFAAGAALAADIIRPGLYLLNTILYSAYHTLRMAMVMSGYAGPFTEDLTAVWEGLDLTTLWNIGSAQSSPLYPLEPVVSQRDLIANQAHPFSPYRPYFQPSMMAPVNVEAPATSFPAQVLAWTMPEDMLDSPVAGIDDMFSENGPALAAMAPTPGPGSLMVTLKTFDGSKRYFGSIMANCEKALTFAVPYLLGTPYPKGVMLPDYNLDSDRGYAWPCWDVEWTNMPFDWNGCDPYPFDTLARMQAWPKPQISWGQGSGPRTVAGPGNPVPLTFNDPFGFPRSGNAWVNAIALSKPGDCQYEDLPFPSIVINPMMPRPGDPRGEPLDGLDRRDPPPPPAPPPPGTPAVTELLGPDYLLAPSAFRYNDPANPTADHAADKVNVYLHLPYGGINTKQEENDGRLSDFLRALASTGDARLILANAVSLWLGGGSTDLKWEGGTVSKPPEAGGDHDLATAVAQLAVTGRRAWTAFNDWNPQDAGLVMEYDGTNFPGPAFAAADKQDAATHVLDPAYTALWAIRSNEPAWRNKRTTMGWIAVSGFEDTPHRPVNVPTAPYPQYDLNVNVPGHPEVTTRFMVASAGEWVAPLDKTSFVNPNQDVLGAPADNLPAGPAPRTLPPNNFVIPGNKIIVYIHGGGSKAEEAVAMANWFIVEGQQAGDKYTVISMDLPNSAYGSAIEFDKVTPTPYDYKRGDVLEFVVQYVTAFIEALDAATGRHSVMDRVVAVMGGSLGGNTSLLLTDRYDKNDRPYLRTIVSWSVTATAPSRYAGVVPGAWAATLQPKGLPTQAVSPESPGDHATQVAYIEKMYNDPLGPPSPLFPLLPLPPQPIMWFRGGYEDVRNPGNAIAGTDWQPWKDMAVAQSRFDRYEIYSPLTRHWAAALDLEQITFSFQDRPPKQFKPEARLMLVAGDNDNYQPNAIYNSTIEVARAIRGTAHGKAEFWLDTGHSIHTERPRLFVREILYFLDHPDAGDSANGTVVSTPPKANYSRVNA